MSSPGGQDCRGLRADAESNRRRIVSAAQQVFGEQGVAAPLTEVADRAGVGIATLYRRFPTRQALVEEAFEDAFAAYDASADMAVAEDDPWEAFAGLVERIGALQAENRGFTHLVQSSVPLGHRRDGRRERTYRKIVEVFDHARTAGAIREDITPEDLPVLSFALAGILDATRDDLPDAWRRHLALFLEGCRPAPAGVLPPAPAPRILQRAMLRSGRRRQQR
ncbi:MAG: TetR/AcrR family transcriptional regulator [Knoellia sp.]